MKKIFTLLFFVVAFATSFAQKGYDRNDQYAENKSKDNFKKYDNHRDNTYFFSAKEKDQQIDKITQDFNLKIKTIKNSPFIGRNKKKGMIKKLKIEKAQQIQAVNSKFSSKYNSANNVYAKQSRKHKH